ncbi:hypothetical protein BH23DEI1_BH23DEI1_14940 [soil metagenome]
MLTLARAVRSSGGGTRPHPTPLALATATLALVAGGVSFAGADAHAHPVWGPALAAQAAAEADALTALGRTDRALHRAGNGLRSRVDVLPSANWNGGPERLTKLGAAVVITGRVDWLHDPAATESARLAHHRTFVGSLEGVHRAVRASTSAYLDVRRAYVALALAEAATASRRATFERAEASVLGRSERAGGANDVELEVARLELERALVGVERAARDLATARRLAAAHGIDVAGVEHEHRRVLDPDPLEGWRLPPADDELESTTVERRRIERDLAHARLERAGAWSALDDVRLEGVAVGRDARLRIGLALDEGRPGGFVEGSLRDATRESWSVSVRARIRIDDGWLDDRAGAHGAAEAADEALAHAIDDAHWARADALAALHDAEDDVVFGERALELGRAALRALDDERVTVAAAARAGEEGAEARLARFDEAYARAVLGHLRERDAFLRAWDRYLRAAERGWVAVGAPFEVRAVTPVPSTGTPPQPPRDARSDHRGR